MDNNSGRSNYEAGQQRGFGRRDSKRNSKDEQEGFGRPTRELRESNNIRDTSRREADFPSTGMWRSVGLQCFEKTKLEHL